MESKHNPQKSWVCCLNGYTIKTKLDKNGPLVNVCAFCPKEDPSEDHIRISHKKVLECLSKPLEDRRFPRKDGLDQHVVHTHGGKLPKQTAEAWKTDSPSDRIRICGFCRTELGYWSPFCSHVAMHFRKGFRMDQWEGDTCV